MSAVERLIDLLKRVGGVALVAMMLVTCVDVIFRYFGHPIFGAVEVVSFLATIVLACAMPQTHLGRGHVGVDLVVRRLSPRSQALIDAATNLVSAILFALVSWQMFLYGAALAKSGEVSMSLEFPTYILVYLVAVAFGVLSLVIASDFLRHLRKVVQS